MIFQLLKSFLNRLELILWNEDLHRGGIHDKTKIAFLFQNRVVCIGLGFRENKARFSESIDAELKLLVCIRFCWAVDSAVV